jgi:hypothetical protein
MKRLARESGPRIVDEKTRVRRGGKMDVNQEKVRFVELLDEEREKQAYQAFLEKHTPFIPREFVQNHGIGCNLVLRKLPFGADYKTDFFYFSKSTDDWNAVFIELEKPSSRFAHQAAG